MMIVPDIILSILAALVGFFVGSQFWTFHLGRRLLFQFLANDSALQIFWDNVFRPHGGVSGILRKKGLAPIGCSPDIYPMGSEVVIHHSFIARRYCGALLLACLAIFVAVSLYTSITVVLFFVVSMLGSVRVRNDRWVFQTLGTLFQNVRLWMEADRASLDVSDRQWMRGIVRIIDANELAGQSDSPRAAA